MRPGNGTCSGDTGTYCSDDGLSFNQETCAPAQGTFCNATTGRCDDACALAASNRSSSGCEFFPTVTANVVVSTFHFAVAVSNANASAADVAITKAGTLVTAVTVPANSTQTILLPWVASLKGPDGSAMPSSVFEQAGAYRLQSSLPVVVYQYSPVEYTNGVTNSYTNDASVLMPSHLWGTTYRVASQPHWAFADFSGTYAITALTDYTTVTVTSSAVIKSGAGLPTTAGSTGTITLNAGDVVEAVTSGTSPDDLTGSYIQSNKPVQVIGGHQCVQVPLVASYCDHIEETIPPATALSTMYVVAAPATVANAKLRRVRIVGMTDGTNLTYDPAEPSLATTLNAGGFTDVDTTDSFRISADHPVLVAEFMAGQTADANNVGDPAMTIAQGVDKFATAYTFVASTNYQANFATIVAPTGTTVTLDGVAVPSGSFSAVGSTGYGVARPALANSGSGQHTITATAPVGVSVYGYAENTSYWYPAMP